jgi:hypothetical protein
MCVSANQNAKCLFVCNGRFDYNSYITTVPLGLQLSQFKRYTSDLRAAAASESAAGTRDSDNR